MGHEKILRRVKSDGWGTRYATRLPDRHKAEEGANKSFNKKQYHHNPLTLND